MPTDTTDTLAATILRTYPEPVWPADLSKWSRQSLESLASDAVKENRQLRSDLRIALDAYRQLTSQTAQTFLPPTNGDQAL